MLSYCSVSILQFSEHFQLIFDNANVNNDKQIKQKMAKFFLQTFQNYQIFLPHPSKESYFGIKSGHNRSAFLLHIGKTFSYVELVSIFSQTFLELIFATKIKTMLLKQSAVLFTSCQKNITFKILFTNKRILT